MNKKQAYEEKLQAQLKEWSAQIDLLKARAENAEAESKVRYSETIEKLQSKKAFAEQKLQELRHAGDDAWTDLQEGLENAWADLGTAVRSAVERFK